MESIKSNNWLEGKGYKKRILIENLKEKVNLIQDVIIPPHTIVSQHKHEYTDEIFYITENSAVMQVENKKFKVKAGDMILVNKQEIHGFENNSSKELKLFVLKINFRKGDLYLK